MSTLLLTRGLPASGKSTWARAWVAEDPATRVRVNRDDLRMMTWNRPSIFNIKGGEDAISAVERAAVLALLKHRDVVVDATHMKLKYVRDWRRFAVAHGHDFAVQDFEVDVDEAIIRDSTRPGKVGEKVILRMARYLKNGKLPLIKDESEPPPPLLVEEDPSLPDAVIFDIDGTLALMGDRNPHDLSRVKHDLPNLPVIEALDMERERGNTIIFLSGREATQQCAIDTEAWLRLHADKTDEEALYQRAEADMRRDSIIKTELFNEHVRGKFNVRRVYDDRNQVVDNWRAMGLTCLQVAPGAF